MLERLKALFEGKVVCISDCKLSGEPVQIVVTTCTSISPDENPDFFVLTDIAGVDYPFCPKTFEGQQVEGPIKDDKIRRIKIM